MMKKTFCLLVLLAAPLSLSAQEHRSPYAGEQTREIKALSSDEVRAYSAGEGMGLAKAAELNGYPGPLHVLELAQQLRLTEAEKTKTEQVRSAMLRDAARLGSLIVEKERELDRLFADAKIDEGRLRSLVGEIAPLQGELRTAHLRAHLEMMRILKPEQIKRYTELRGYDSGTTPHKGHPH
jgi:Spy/CpxP family protein refolding chaperone